MKYLLFILLFSSCAPKSQILGGMLCDCGEDNPSWRKGYCPECLNFTKKVVDTTQELYIFNLTTNNNNNK